MTLKQIVQSATTLNTQTIAVAAAADEDVLMAVVDAHKKGLAQFYLVGDEHDIKSLLAKLDYASNHFTIVHTEGIKEACQKAVELVKNNEASALMKGLVPTADLLRVVVHKDNGLAAKTLLSHVAVFDIPGFERTIYLTDAAMNIAPDLKQKVDIVNNAVGVAHALGNERPKVGSVCPVEVVNPAMPSTVDAASLTLMGQRGQIKGCDIDGPLALDNAISLDAAKHKGITSAVAGQCDILLASSIEVANTLYKSLVYFAKADVGAIIVGAPVPIILTSRADSAQAKLYSIALAAQYAAFYEQIQ